MNRFEDWPRLLADFTDGARGRPFAWGVWDCALAAAACVQALTGEDFGAPYRGRYRSAAGAARVLRRVSGGGLVAAATRALGAPLPTPRMAQRGDVCLIDTPAGEALAWCLGAELGAAGPDGLVLEPLSAARMAWRV